VIKNLKKIIIIALILSFISFILISFNCNLSNAEKKSDLNYNVLDENLSQRLLVTCTIAVNGSTWDGNGITLDGSGVDSDEPPPIFRVTNGSLTNVIIDPMGAAGIWLYGNCAVSNVTSGAYKDAGMMHAIYGLISIKSLGSSTISNITSNDLAHAPFQINSMSTASFINITVNNKYNDYPMIRQNGGTTWKCVIYIDGVNLTNPTHAVVRSDSLSTTVNWRNITSSLPQSSWFYGNFTVNTY